MNLGNRKTSAALPLIILFLASAPWAQASFQNVPLSIKSEGLGGAFVALADDASSVFVNPAGMSTLDRAEATIMYGKPLAGVEGIALSEGYLAVASPLGRSTALGFGGTAFKASGLLSEYQGTASFASQLSAKISVGVSANYFYHTYDIANDPNYSGMSVFANGRSRGAPGFNAGMLAFLSPKIQLGAVIRNINEPNVGLHEADPVPRELRVGGLYRLSRANLLAELGRRNDGLGTENSQVNTWSLGAEVPLSALSLRAGVNQNGMSAGFGVRFGLASVDYSFSLIKTALSSSFTSQRLAMSFRIGSSQAALFSGSLEAEEAAKRAALKGTDKITE